MKHGEREALYGALAEWRRMCWERYVGPTDGITGQALSLVGFAAYRKCAEAHERLF